MIQFLKDELGVFKGCSISSDLYAEILKSNKGHTNRLIQIVLCKAVFRILYKLQCR